MIDKITLRIITFILVSLVIKMWYYREVVFNGSQLLETILVELPFLLLISFIGLFFKKGRVFFYFAIDFCISLLLFISLMYFSYYGAIPTYSALMQIDQLDDVKDSVFELLSIKYLLLLFDFPIIFLLYKLDNRKIKINKYILIIVIIIVVIFPINNVVKGINYTNNLSRANAMGILPYQGYAFLKDKFREKHLSYNSNESIIDEIRQIKNLEVHENPLYTGIAKNKNLIIVQLEAFQAFPLNKEINNQEITPNLNNLKKSSLYFSNTFQQIGKGNTSDAEFIINTSIYPVGDKAMSEEFSDMEIPSLPRILNSKGYETITFHTNDVSFWNREKMYKSLGFKSVYDVKYFGNDDIIAFGPSDEILYNKSLDKLKEISNGKNFYAHLIAMSSHHPFEIPREKIDIILPKELKDSTLGKYIEAIHYVDKTLGYFIEGLKQNGLWDDTLFIVYGDHSGYIPDNKNEKYLYKRYFTNEYNEKIDKFKIPLFIKLPESTVEDGETLTNTVGQIDILPTILNLIGEDTKNLVLFGQDIINYKENLIGMRFYAPQGTYINNKAFYSPIDELSISLEDRKIITEESDLLENRIIELLELSDKYIYSLKDKNLTDSLSNSK